MSRGYSGQRQVCSVWIQHTLGKSLERNDFADAGLLLFLEDDLFGEACSWSEALVLTEAEAGAGHCRHSPIRSPARRRSVVAGSAVGFSSFGGGCATFGVDSAAAEG